MPESLQGQFISDYYTSLLHLSGKSLGAEYNQVYDGEGNITGMALSGNRVVINNYIMPTTSTISNFIDSIYPVGIVIFTIDGVNPGTKLEGTTWERIAQGKFVAGVGTGTDKNAVNSSITVGDTNDGEYTHRLNVGELPAHTHSPVLRYASTGDDNAAKSGYLGTSPRLLQDVNKDLSTLSPPAFQNSSTGSNTPHNNIPPYIGLYVWKRTV